MSHARGLVLALAAGATLTTWVGFLVPPEESVFGIEYLDNEAPLRTGITPSLIARYTTGWQLGAKAFYRVQLPDFWSAFSLNAAVTNNSTFIDSLQPSAVSLLTRVGSPTRQATPGRPTPIGRTSARVWATNPGRCRYGRCQTARQRRCRR